MAKRPHSVTEKSKKNLTGQGRFANNKEIAKECQKLSVAKRKENQKKSLEIETSAQILARLLQGEITNNTTGEKITQKEAMLLTLLSQAIKEKNLKAIEMILKIIGDFSEVPQSNLFINQPVKIDKAVIDKSIKEIMTLADE